MIQAFKFCTHLWLSNQLPISFSPLEKNNYFIKYFTEIKVHSFFKFCISFIKKPLKIKFKNKIGWDHQIALQTAHIISVLGKVD